MLERAAFLARYGALVLRELRQTRIAGLGAAAPSCVVLGNGPSLADDLERQFDAIAARPKVCVNNFAKSEYYERLKPEHYVLADTAYFSADTQRILADIDAGRTNSYSADAVDYYRYLTAVKDSVYRNMVDKTSWDMTLFVPLHSRLQGDLGWISQRNPRIRLAFFNMTPLSSGPAWLRHRLYRMNLAVPRAETVLVAAIFLALQMGYRNLYVLGADHSWHENFTVGRDNVLRVRDPHFYDAPGETPTVPLVKDHITGETWKMHEQWHSLGRAFESHVALAEYARALGARILNASAKSYLDAYERADVGAAG
jgi:hypothetical protein